MDQVVREHEQIIMEDLKKNYLESQKRINHDKLQEMSKAQQKKHEKNLLQGWQTTNSALG
jgi:hypothetical protein